MRMNFEEELKPLSFGALVTATAGALSTIDRKDAEEVLCALVGVSVASDGYVDVKWQESEDDSTWADISGAAHDRKIIDPNAIVTSADIADGAYTIAAQPAAPSLLTLDATDADTSVTEHIVTIVGTGWDDITSLRRGTRPKAVSDVYTLSTDGLDIWTSTKIFATVTSVTGSATAGTPASSTDVLVVGVNNFPIPVVGRMNLLARKRYIRAYWAKSGTLTAGAFVATAILGKYRSVPVGPVVDADFAI